MRTTSNSDGIAWPKQTTIARETGLSERGVRKATDRLIKLGLVQRRREGKPYHYRLLVKDALERIDFMMQQPDALSAARS